MDQFNSFPIVIGSVLFYTLPTLLLWLVQDKKEKYKKETLERIRKGVAKTTPDDLQQKLCYFVQIRLERKDEKAFIIDGLALFFAAILIFEIIAIILAIAYNLPFILGTAVFIFILQAISLWRQLKLLNAT